MDSRRTSTISADSRVMLDQSVVPLRSWNISHAIAGTSPVARRQRRRFTRSICVTIATEAPNGSLRLAVALPCWLPRRSLTNETEGIQGEVVGGDYRQCA